MVRLIGNVLLYWAALASLASWYLHARGPWRRSPMGIHLMAYLSAITAVLVLAVMRSLFGSPLWFDVVRLVVFVAVPATITWRLVIQFQAQRMNRAARESAPWTHSPPPTVSPPTTNREG